MQTPASPSQHSHSSNSYPRANVNLQLAGSGLSFWPEPHTKALDGKLDFIVFSQEGELRH